MLRSKLASLSLAALAATSFAACDRGPLFNVTNAVPISAAQPTFALGWDSSELRHPRVDVFSFDGARFVRSSGMSLSFVHPASIIAAVEAPFPVLVQRSSGAVFATGPDGFVLAPIFGNPTLSSLTALFLAIDTDPTNARPALVGFDDRGRVQWRREFDPAVRCATSSLATPDRTRAIVFESQGCTAQSSLVVIDERGTQTMNIAHDALSNPPEGRGLSQPSVAVRDDMSVAITTQSQLANGRPIGAVHILSPSNPTPARFDFEHFNPLSIAPVGTSRWLVAGAQSVYTVHDGRIPYTSRDESFEAFVIDDEGRTSERVKLATYYGGAVHTLVATPRGTALVFASSPGVAPRVLVFGPDGRKLTDSRMDLAAVAREVEPPLSSQR